MSGDIRPVDALHAPQFLSDALDKLNEARDLVVKCGRIEAQTLASEHAIDAAAKILAMEFVAACRVANKPRGDR